MSFITQAMNLIYTRTQPPKRPRIEEDLKTPERLQMELDACGASIERNIPETTRIIKCMISGGTGEFCVDSGGNGGDGGDGGNGEEEELQPPIITFKTERFDDEVNMFENPDGFQLKIEIPQWTNDSGDQCTFRIVRIVDEATNSITVVTNNSWTGNMENGVAIYNIAWAPELATGDVYRIVDIKWKKGSDNRVSQEGEDVEFYVIAFPAAPQVKILDNGVETDIIHSFEYDGNLDIEIDFPEAQVGDVLHIRDNQGFVNYNFILSASTISAGSMTLNEDIPDGNTFEVKAWLETEERGISGYGKAHVDFL